MTPDVMGKQIEQLHEKINKSSIQIVELNVKMAQLCSLIEKSSGDEGFNRCAVRLEKLTRLEHVTGYIVKTGISATVIIGIVEIVRFLITMHHLFPK